MRRQDTAAVDWMISPRPVAYPEALARMAQRVAAIQEGRASELVWLLEHPPLYTAGTSAREQDLLAPARFPVFRSGRGGQFTYHGPGQRVVYLMLDLRPRRPDVRAFVSTLEGWLIETLAHFGIRGHVHQGRVGVWVTRASPQGPEATEDKIAAIGIRVQRWVTMHGISLNVAPDLEHFSGIVPCGIHGAGVTSLEALGVPADMAEVDAALRAAFERRFGQVEPAAWCPTI